MMYSMIEQRMTSIRCVSISNNTKIYYFAQISLIPPWISFSPFATCLVDSPLSITDVFTEVHLSLTVIMVMHGVESV